MSATASLTLQSDPQTDTLDLLDWPEVLSHLAGFCMTPMGLDLIESGGLDCGGDVARIETALGQVDEAKQLIQRFPIVSLQPTLPCTGLFQRLLKGGQCHHVEEASQCLVSLVQWRMLARYFIQNRSKPDSPHLSTLIEAMTLPNQPIEQLEAIVTEKNDFRPDASDTLFRLSQQIRQHSQALEDRLNQAIRKHPLSKYVQEPIVTQREGRFVLPVKVEHKSDVPGLIHDTSSTGATLYIEPKNAVDDNNRIIQLQAEFRQEQQRLLAELSAALAPYAEEVLGFIEAIGQLDVLQAKAHQSLVFRANPVTISPEPGHLHLLDARHPLLILQHLSDPQSVIGNDITMTAPHQVMIITGPNTGGKTVTLKLVGLCLLMLHHGLHIPVKEGSSMSLFKALLCDIGDSQSVIHNLSTFSGHIQRLSRFCERNDLDQALILIDEICAGTDPEQGSVLAQALLNHYETTKATTLVTTHLGRLKFLAYEHPHYLNARVEFDTDTLQPTYRLSIGVSGTSHALDIAEKLGLNPAIINQAKVLGEQAKSQSHELLSSLESQHAQMGKALRESQRIQSEVQEKEQTIQSELDRLERKKKNALDQFKRSLKDKLSGIEQELNDMRKALKHQRIGSVSELEQLKQRFRASQFEFSEAMHEEQQQLFTHRSFEWDTLAVGDDVESRDLNIVGTIVEKNDKRQILTIQSGALKSTIPLADVVNHRPASGRKWKARSYERNPYRPKTIGILKLEHDVRGMKAEAALESVNQALDNALLQHARTLEIIHGKGTGVLRKVIQDHLKTLPFVKSFRSAEAIDGGQGKTIVEFEDPS